MMCKFPTTNQMQSVMNAKDDKIDLTGHHKKRYEKKGKSHEKHESKAYEKKEHKRKKYGYIALNSIYRI